MPECPGCGREMENWHGVSVHVGRYCDEITEEQKEKVHEMNSGENHHCYGNTHSKESKQKMREQQLGEKNTMHGKTGKDNPFYGKTHSRQTKKKILESMPDMSGANNPNFKHGKYLKRHCKNCGDLYKPELPEQKYCSKQCMAEGYSESKAGRFCQRCSDFYIPTHNKQRYCSVQCATKATARNSDMPGFYWAIRQSLGNKSWQELRKEHDPQECYKCGATENLHIHHIIPVMAGGLNGDWNLMTLCQSCHKKVENRTQEFVTRHLDVTG